MCRTPAPPSTPFVASTTWSGTGEVNTSPAQAASSMPRPTNPPWSGSWPEPPPEMSPTFPEIGASPRAGGVSGASDARGDLGVGAGPVTGRATGPGESHVGQPRQDTREDLG